MDNVILSGVIITELQIIEDDRGAILHMIRNDSKDFKSFGECYFSEILPNVIKGWKKHSKQEQNISVPVGLVKFVLVDTRVNSSTFNKMQEVVLGRHENYTRLKIPAEIWYSFKCISKEKSLLVNCPDIPHDKNESEILQLFNNKINYKW